MNEDLRQLSRRRFSTPETVDYDMINTSCLMRIADASEAMAKNYNDLINENKRLKERVEFLNSEQSRVALSNISLRGHITRLKNKLRNTDSNETA